MQLRRVATTGTALALAFTAGIITHAQLPQKQATPSSAFATNTAKYPLLGKRLFVDNPNDAIINFENLRQSLTTYWSQNNLGGSFYFEYLPTGTSIRVDGDKQQVAASLMKLPSAMDLYKAAELGKVDLDKTIALQPSWLDPGYGDLYQKGAGYELSLRDAGKIMLEKSDNTALKAVTLTTFGMIKPEDSVLNAVDIDVTQNPDLTVSISARSYGSFLKCLYFACYDNNDNSQQILDYLAHTPFNDRLVAGVADKNITVAHKIGVWSDTQSDCGIVYLPQRNYLFCAMVKGADDAATKGRIADLSKMVYEYVKNR